MSIAIRIVGNWDSRRCDWRHPYIAPVTDNISIQKVILGTHTRYDITSITNKIPTITNNISSIANQVATIKN
jgi:hypothetical protein